MTTSNASDQLETLVMRRPLCILDRGTQYPSVLPSKYVTLGIPREEFESSVAYYLGK